MGHNDVQGSMMHNEGILKKGGNLGPHKILLITVPLIFQIIYLIDGWRHIAFFDATSSVAC